MKINKKGSSNIILIAVIAIAIICSLGVYFIVSSSMEKVYVSTVVLKEGTQMNNSMLINNEIVIKEVPKDMVNKYTVLDFDEVEGKYLKSAVYPGKTLFSYDVSSSDDMKNNEILKTYNLEAITIPASRQTGLSDEVKAGDKINLYGIYNYDLSGYMNAQGIVYIEDLPEESQKIFLENGYVEDDYLRADEVMISKLMLQNVPIVDVSKEEGQIIKFTVGVEPAHAEMLYLTLKTGSLGVTVLPYQEGTYVEKATKGSVSNLELINTGIINDLNESEIN